ncbi:MAG: DUF2218 domain-containing protein [Chloroflexota bacterium]
MGEISMVNELPAKVIDGALSHMNEDHQENLIDYARHFSGCDWAESAEMTALDGLGFEILVRGNGQEETKRIDFPHPVADAKGLRKALVQMAMTAKGSAPTGEESDGIRRSASANVETAKASRYLKALCNHFDRKANASYTDNKGTVEFEFGDCTLVASDTHLAIEVGAESEAMLERTMHVVGGHLVRFGKKDELVVNWEHVTAE